ncbi:MAG: ABC transporter ATP-binding protein [Planctomycetota bacterium]
MKSSSDSKVGVRLEGVGLNFRLYRNRRPNLKSALLNLFGAGAKESHEKETFPALKEVDLTFAPGDRVGIIGRNGAGKSSLLRVIAGIYRPSYGTVQTDGFLVPLFQVGLGFMPELTGQENVEQAGAMFGLDREAMRERSDAIFEFAELQEFRETPLKYYSRGMGMRLAFTATTSIQPEILLLDEVFGGGDQGFREKAVQRMEELIERTPIVITVSHSMGIVKRIANRVLWLEKGRIHMDGEASEVIEAYEKAVADQA